MGGSRQGWVTHEDMQTWSKVSGAGIEIFEHFLQRRSLGSAAQRRKRKVLSPSLSLPGFCRPDRSEELEPHRAQEILCCFSGQESNFFFFFFPHPEWQKASKLIQKNEMHLCI